MKVSGDDYIEGAGERIGATYAMYTASRFVDAIYLAGVARRFRSEIKRLQLDRGIKGDALKENARVTLENALTLVNKGTFQWKKK